MSEFRIIDRGKSYSLYPKNRNSSYRLNKSDIRPILEFLTHNAPASVRDLAAAFNIQTTKAHAIICFLREAGFLDQRYARSARTNVPKIKFTTGVVTKR